MENELKPCPMCRDGGSPRFSEGGIFDAPPLVGVYCRDCGLDMPINYPTEADAATAWNTRASDNRRCGDCVHWRQELDDPDRKVGMCIKTDTPREAGFDCADFTKKEEK